jgi:hypothetical protein
MKRNKAAVGVSEGRQSSPRLVAVLIVGSLIIGPYLAGSVLARSNSDAPRMGSKKISEVSAMNKNKPSPIQRSVQTPWAVSATRNKGQDRLRCSCMAFC